MMRYVGISVLLFLTGCISQFAALQGGDLSREIAIEELRSELAELRHALHATTVEMSLLEEKVEDHIAAKNNHLKEALSSLEVRLASLELSQEKVGIDLRNLSHHAQQTVSSLVQYQDKIQQIDRKIATSNQQKPPSKSEKYTVQPGDTLQKIAHRLGISISSLKEANRLESDKIMIGQHLSIPSS